MRGVGGLQIRVAVILGIAGTIVFQAQQLVSRVRDATKLLGATGSVATLPVLHR